jgi:hypothetical protein
LQRRLRDVVEVPLALLGQRQLVSGVHLEVFLRRDVRRVRPIEATGDEEGLVLVLFEQLDRHFRADGVGLFAVFAIGGQPAWSAAELARRKTEDLGLVVPVAAAGVVLRHPRRRVVQAVGADVAGHAVVIELADAGHEIAVLLEHLRKRDGVGHVLAKLRGVFPDARLIGPQSGQEAGPAGITKRELAIGPVEPHAAAGKLVDPRRLDDRIAIAA